jgi:hypothetical protein
MDRDIILKRLAFIKYLYGLGENQSHLPEPLSGCSILMFHDSIEMFLQLAKETLDAPRKEKNFEDYWDLIKECSNNLQISQKESCRRLNKSRVDLKHYGILPSASDIECFRATAANFFIDNTLLIFNCEFDQISFIDLINCEKSRSEIILSLKDRESGDYSSALNHLALAFYHLIHDYENRKSNLYGKSPFFFGKPLTFNNSFHMHIKERRMADFIDKVKESVESMQDAMKILSLGFDYRKFTKFSLLTPTVVQLYNGKYCFSERRSNVKASQDDCEYCEAFIIECAIKLNQFDYTLQRDEKNS